MAFAKERLQERLQWAAVGGDETGPIDEDDLWFSPHLERLKDGKIHTNADYRLRRNLFGKWRVVGAWGTDVDEALR